mgnify:CR=1 FL=1
MSPTHGSLPLQRAAKIAGAAFLFTTAASVFAGVYVGPSLIVRGDAVRTASNIMAHEQLFRVSIVCDLLNFLGVVILNWALYELLAPVHRSFARLAAMFRVGEACVGGAITASSVVAVTILTGAPYLQVFEPGQIKALARLFLSAHGAGYNIALVFFSFGSTIYWYLVVKSRYVPNVLAWSGLLASVLAGLYFLGDVLSPAFVSAATAAALGLPVSVRVLLALIFVPIFSFEVTLGTWLLVKGVRIPEPHVSRHPSVPGV